VLGEWTYEGEITSTGGPSIPKVCRLRTFGATPFTYEYSISLARYQKPDRTSFAFDWDKIGGQVDDMRVEPPRFYHAAELFDSAGKPLSMDAILARSKAKLAELDEIRAEERARAQSMKAERRERPFFVAGLLILGISTLLWGFIRRKNLRAIQ
jgi:hypothetical protein